jgi:hypothetical protein
MYNKILALFNQLGNALQQPELDYYWSEGLQVAALATLLS